MSNGGGGSLDRRRFLKAGAALASGLALSVSTGLTSASSSPVSTLLPRPQTPLPAVSLDPVTIRAIRHQAALDACDQGQLLVVSYHQVFPDPVSGPPSRNPFSVTVSQLLGHLTMLRSIGFTPIRLADVLRAQRTGLPLPPRSVLLTFDDGTAGQWTQADAVLRTTGFSAVTFLITSYVGSDPDFLTWPEVHAMAASGRWEIGDHTHDDHHTVAVGPSLEMESALINRAWDPRRRTLETLPAAETRVRTDFAASFATLSAHKLTRPVAFAFPFSRVDGPTNDHSFAAYVDTLAAQLFPLRFTSTSPGQLSGPLDIASGLLKRIETHQSTTTLGLYEKIREANALALLPASLRPRAFVLHEHPTGPVPHPHAGGHRH